jgi:hypothetical protein
VQATLDGVTTVYVGQHYEVAGSTVKKYYSHGGQRGGHADGRRALVAAGGSPGCHLAGDNIPPVRGIGDHPFAGDWVPGVRGR